MSFYGYVFGGLLGLIVALILLYFVIILAKIIIAELRGFTSDTPLQAPVYTPPQTSSKYQSDGYQQQQYYQPQNLQNLK